MKILDFGKGGAVKSSSIQFMTGLDGPNVTHIGFVDGTEDDFMVNPQTAFALWSGTSTSVAVIMAADQIMIDFSHIAAIQLFAAGHEDSQFPKKEAVFRIWFDHGELFIPTARYVHMNKDAYLRFLVDEWKKLHR